MNIFKAILLSTGLVLIFFSPVNASFQDTALRRANDAVGGSIGDYVLSDQDGREFSTRELNGKPVVINLIYTSCGHICPTINLHLQDAFKEAGSDFGAKFSALTIGFDVENDTPKNMKAYGMNFTDDFSKWRFASADKETIARIAGDLGFYYRKSEMGFDHLNMVTVVDATGRIFRQVYGLDFKPADILDPLYASMGRIKITGSGPQAIIDAIKLFCYRYDESTGRYRLDYGAVAALIAVSLLQGLTIAGLIYFIFGKRLRRA